MPLPLPNLDDRRWPDLIDEGRALIPRYAPGWTDHNVHDPGITLMELFAWLTEMTIYRLNQVPARHRRKFLALTGFRPRPPRAARTVLTFSPEAGVDSFDLPAGTEFEAAVSDGAAIPFRTLRDVTVAPVTLETIRVEPEPGTIHDRTEEWREGLPLAALGETPTLEAALYLGFSHIPSNTPVALAFRFQGTHTGPAERERIWQELAAQRHACRQILPDITCEGQAEPSEERPATLAHHSARLAWEISTGADTWTRLSPITAEARPAAGQVRDDTRALTLDGIVEVNLPDSIAKRTLVSDGEPPLYYLRARLAAGAYEAAPLLLDIAPNSVQAEQAVPAWQSFTVAPEAELPPAETGPEPGSSTRLNLQLDSRDVITRLTVPAVADAPDHPLLEILSFERPEDEPGHLTLAVVLLGRGSGWPNQQIILPQAPVQGGSLRLYSHTGEQWQAWTRRPDFDGSVRTDFHYVLDAASGRITFGDGEAGRVVPEGDLIFAAYRATQADKGNVEADTITQLADTPRNSEWLSGLTEAAGTEDEPQLPAEVTNRHPAAGGAGAESLAAATGRAVERLHAHERLLELCDETHCRSLDELERGRIEALPAPTRAVNLLDLERLALEMPGVQLARARAWPGFHPDYPCLQAAGVVTVMIVPDTAGSRPEPSRGLLDAVRRYLDRRRMVATRLEVVGPEYLTVRVESQIRLRPHVDVERARQQIRQTLDQFLDPLRGGPEGRGWPFGRAVYRTEILQQIDGVPGVDHVLALRLAAGTGESQCGNLALCPTWLVTPGEHKIEIIRSH